MHLHRTVTTAVTPSPHVLHVAGMFGLGIDAQRELTLIPPTDLSLRPHQVVFITGPGGSGKSTLLRLIAEHRPDALHFDQLPPPPDRPIVDALGNAPIEQVLRWLSLAGLNDAFVMLRRPGELSDGQRYRLRLAQVMAMIDAMQGRVPRPSGRASFEGLETGGGSVGAQVQARAEARGTPAHRDPSCDRARHSPSVGLEHSAQPTRPSPDTPPIILADEFGATLDRLTAQVIARNVRRWVDRTPVTFVAATTHDDLLEALAPDVLIEKPLGDRVDVVPRPADAPRPSLDADLRLKPGTMHDYHALAHHHYRASHPATATRVLALRDPRPTVVGRYLARRDATQTVGVLVESLPSLACRMRDWALRDRYGSWLPPRQRARLLRDELRCISRVVIDPRCRGLGLAVRLVRAALDSAQTPFTEALAAMGRVHPFFERAGMTAYRRPTHVFDARLLAALARVGIEPIDLADLRRVRQRLAALEAPSRRWLQRELHRWYRQNGGGRARDHSTDPADHLRLAQQRLLLEPVYYLHDNREEVSRSSSGASS